MNTILKTRMVKIGNSRGIRIPKLFLDQVDLGEEVELELQEDQIVIRPARSPRQGWDEKFRTMAQEGDDQLLDEIPGNATIWDTAEWEW
ncbi:MAG: AbrB/MazE/SpoVT family DNA-binding domain-containing protein [Chloroflexi bacterium]|nr:AbrB/MazE/SpoVT family DNA-binding domain-containing protein [Chloroflexota bacterium]